MVYAYTKNTLKVTRLTVQQVLDDGVFFAGSLEEQGPAFVSVTSQQKGT